MEARTAKGEGGSRWLAFECAATGLAEIVFKPIRGGREDQFEFFATLDTSVVVCWHRPLRLIQFGGVAAVERLAKFAERALFTSRVHA